MRFRHPFGPSPVHPFTGSSPKAGALPMPFHLPPISRRRFLAGALAAGAGLVFRRGGWAAEGDPDRWALLSDPHVAADPAMVKSGVNMTEHLRRVTAEVLARA